MGGHAVPRPVLRPNKYQSQFARGPRPSVRPARGTRHGRVRVGGASGLHVPLHVQRQVVGAREGAVAKVALERPVARVLAVVAREFVRARELPAAAVPVAVVGLLAWRGGGARAGLSFPPGAPRCAKTLAPESGYLGACN